MDNHEEYKLNVTHHMQVYVDEDVHLMEKIYMYLYIWSLTITQKCIIRFRNKRKRTL
jgi:hypothetical protein